MRPSLRPPTRWRISSRSSCTLVRVVSMIRSAASAIGSSSSRSWRMRLGQAQPVAAQRMAAARFAVALQQRFLVGAQEQHFAIARRCA